MEDSKRSLAFNALLAVKDSLSLDDRVKITSRYVGREIRDVCISFGLDNLPLQDRRSAAVDLVINCAKAIHDVLRYKGDL